MIIKDFKKAHKFTSLEAICGKYVFQLRPSFDALVLDLGNGLTVSFRDNADYASFF